MVFKLLETERIVLPVVGIAGHCLEDSGSHSTGNHLTLWASDPTDEVEAAGLQRRRTSPRSGKSLGVWFFSLWSLGRPSVQEGHSLRFQRPGGENQVS